MLTNRLLSLRENNNLTQTQMAKIIGVKRGTYSQWEIKDEIIPLEHLNSFSNKFDINLDYLTGISNTKDSNFKHIKLNKKNIGKRLRQIRESRNLSQRDVAKLINTSHSVISRYENGKALIKTAFLIDFAKNTKSSIDWICCKK